MPDESDDKAVTGSGADRLVVLLVWCAVFASSGCAMSASATTGAAGAAMHSPSEATCDSMPSSYACWEWRAMNADGP
jgi:hypothetical protein